MNKFYSFQTEMNITNQHCFHNCRYIVEYLKNYNINVKSVNGYSIMERVNNGKTQTCKLEHNWIEYDGDIIEPNKFINDLKNKKYYRFNQKNKMYRDIHTTKKEKLEDTRLQKIHLKIFLTKPYGLHLGYELMIRSRVIDRELCNEINGEVNEYNMIEKMKQSGCKVYCF